MTLSELLQRENNNIDLVRLFTALMVMWFHLPALFQGRFPHIPSLTPIGVGVGYLGVAVFFFLSGLLVTNSLLSKRRVVPFVWSRAMRILPAFYLCVLVGVFVVGPLMTTIPVADYFASFNTWHFLKNNLLLNIEYNLPGLWEDRVYGGWNGSAWSIPFEVGCYIVLLASFALCSRFRGMPAWLPAVVALLFSLVPTHWVTRMLGTNYSIIVMGDVFCFAVGALMAVYKDHIRMDRTVVLSLIVACVLFWRCQRVVYYLYPLAVALTLLYATSLPPLLRLHLRHDISYGVYLWHWPVIQIVYTYLGSGNLFMFVAVSLVLTLSLAYVSARLVEEPCIRLGRTLGQRCYLSRKNDGWFVLLFLLIAVLVGKFCY